MPPPRGRSEIPGKERNVLSKAKRKGDAVEFSEDTFAKWVTGAHKRRVERQKIGHKQAADMIKAEKAADRREQNEKVREIVKRQFGDVSVDNDGRLVFSGVKNGLSGDMGSYDSDEEFEYKQKLEQKRRDKKLELIAKEAQLKSLPKWAKDKKQKEIELQKDDSIVKEQNESFLKAQYSFNKEEKLKQISNLAEKNKLLNNLQRVDHNERLEQNKAAMMPSVMNFENDDSVVVVETSNMNISTGSIIPRRAQRELASKSTGIDTNRIGRRGAAITSKQVHTMGGSDSDFTSSDSNNDDNSDDYDDNDNKNTKSKLSKNVKTYGKKAQAEKPVLTPMQQLQSKFNNKKSKNEKLFGKKARKSTQPKKSTKSKANNDDEISEDEHDYYSTDEEEELNRKEQIKKSKLAKKTKAKKPIQPDSTDEDDIGDEDDDMVEIDDDDEDAEYDFDEEIDVDGDNSLANDEDDDNDGEEWSVVDEKIITDGSDDDVDDDEDEVVQAKLDKELKKRREKEYKEQAASLRKEQEQQRRVNEQRLQEEAEVKHQSKRQKSNAKLDSEVNRDRDLATQISSSLINNELSLERAQAIPMANASAWFMLPLPKAWVDEDERKKKLLQQRQRQAQIQDGTWDHDAERQRNHKLTPLEQMELDPTYGWEEGEGTNSKDLGEIFGIPAASMGGRHRKKPLSDKNKKRSSDARKAKKQEKQRQKDQQMAMSFEAGFADTNVTGRTIKWDDSSDDDDFRVYTGGAKFKKEPKNRQDRKKLEFKKKMKEQNAHKKGKMVSGKYYFGEKDSTVTF